MKKLMQLLIVLSILIGFSACGNKAQEESIQEIINKSIKASENLKSFHISMNIEIYSQSQ